MNNVVEVTKFDRAGWDHFCENRKKGQMMDHRRFYVTTRYDLDTMTDGEKIALLNELTQNWDEDYEYSDDPRVYRAGRAHHDKIIKVRRSLDI